MHAATNQTIHASMPLGYLPALVPAVVARTRRRQHRARKRCSSARSGSLEQRSREQPWIERAQVLDRLADADQLDRQAELAGHRPRAPPARAAVELGAHE